jgi:serine/threonine protein kinase
MLSDQTLWNTSATTAPGTLRWKAPELLERSQAAVSIEADIYAYAMTSLVSLFINFIESADYFSFQEVMTGKPPFSEYNYDGGVIVAVVTHREIPRRPTLSDISDSLWQQWTRCWDRNASLRPKMSQITR